MEIKQNPFSFYDFLGYLTLGAVFLYGILFMVGHIHQDPIDFSSVTSHLTFEKTEIYIPFVLAAYISGHFLSFLSSITIERYSIWAHGYPSKYLLGKRARYFPAKDNTRKVVRFLTGILLTPITVFDWALGEKMGMRALYAKQLDKYLIAVLNNKIAGLTIDHICVIPKNEEHGTASEVDFFLFAYHYAVENAPNHFSKMQNYVALYGFLRTLTFISLLVYWELWWHTLSGVITVSNGLYLMLGVAAFTYLMFMAFVKFYRRFSLEALMAMAVSYQENDSYNDDTEPLNNELKSG
jgi:hypothetical protein